MCMIVECGLELFTNAYRPNEILKCVYHVRHKIQSEQ